MELALLVLRVVVGLFFVGHGAQKLWGSFGGHGIAGTAQFFESIGVRPGRRNALAAGWSEFLGGLLLALGLVTPLAAVLIISVMTVAIITVHASKGPWVSDGGWELNAVYIAVAFAITGAGPGEISLDDAIGWMPDITGAGWALIALGVGALGGLGAVLTSRRPETAGPDLTDTAKDERFDRTPNEKRSATIAQDDRPGIPADPR
jgi:putative oxidoreductase